MTGKEKIAEMLESGEFAEELSYIACPSKLGLQNVNRHCCGTIIEECISCWRKALESEVGGVIQ